MTRFRPVILVERHVELCQRPQVRSDDGATQEHRTVCWLKHEAELGMGAPNDHW